MRIKKRVTALVLCAAMIITSLSVPETAEKVLAAGESQTKVSSSDKTVLKDFGFDLSGEYAMDALNDTQKMANHKSELVMASKSNMLNVSMYEYDSRTAYPSYMHTMDTKQKRVVKNFGANGEKANDYNVAVAFNPENPDSRNMLNGGKGYVAILTLEDKTSADDTEQEILLSVVEAGTGTVLLENEPTGGCICTGSGFYQVPATEVQGLLNMVAGDFDGDNMDELAVYVPNNSAAVETNVAADGWPSNKLEIKIYDLDLTDYNPTVSHDRKTTLPAPTKVINIAEGTKEWAWSTNGSQKYNYCIPYMAMAADDVNGDGMDELMTIANFSWNYRGFNSTFTGYSSFDVYDVDKCFASVLDVYEGGKDDKLLTQTVTKKPLTASAPNYSGYRCIFRNANITVADMTGKESRDIVIAGNFTAAANAMDDTDRYVSTRQAQPGLVIGYTDYDKLKNNQLFTECITMPPYEKQKIDMSDNVAEPVALAGFAAHGAKKRDSVFCEGRVVAYTMDKGLYDTGYVPGFASSNDSTYATDRIWIGTAAAGNFVDSTMGEEMVYYTISERFYHKTAKAYIYVTGVVCLWGNIKADGTKTYASYCNTGSAMGSTGLTRGSDKQYTTLCTADAGVDSPYVSYKEGNGETYYSKVGVLSVLQAAPAWKELGDDYVTSASTVYKPHAKTGSLKVNSVMQVQSDDSYFGLERAMGMDFDEELLKTLGYQGEYSKTASFDEKINVGAKDKVVIYTVPYTSYSVSLYVPSCELPTKEEYLAKKAFKEELENNLNGAQGTVYANPGDGYNNQFDTAVGGKYDVYMPLYQRYVNWLNKVESNIAEFNKGGTRNWGDRTYGSTEACTISIPQEPQIMIVDVDKYNQIAANCTDLEVIGDTIWNEGYKAGDPSSYASTISDLPAVEYNGKTAESMIRTAGKKSVGVDTDTADKPTVTNASISYLYTSNPTVTAYDKAMLDSMVIKKGNIEKGITLYSSMVNGIRDYNYHYGSGWSTNYNCQFKGNVPNLPAGTNSAYGYDWQLVSYTAKLGDSYIPVIGYLTEMKEEVLPPSLPNDFKATELKNGQIQFTWTEGDRPADSYNIYRINENGTKIEKIGTVPKSAVDMYTGIFTYIYTDGAPDGTKYSYAIQSVTATGIESTLSNPIQSVKEEETTTGSGGETETGSEQPTENLGYIVSDIETSKETERTYYSYASYYYYNQLTATQKKLWDELDAICYEYLTTTKNLNAYTGAEGTIYGTSIVKTTLATQDVKKIVASFIVSNPQYYFLTNLCGITEGSERSVYIRAYENFADGEARKNATDELFAVINEWNKQIDACVTDFEKIKKVNDLICENTVYDENALTTGDSPEKTLSSVYSVFMKGNAICDGYMKTTSLLLSGAGLDAVSIVGRQKYPSGVEMAHGWNMVRANGSWYNIDVTFADTGGGYEYFLRSDEKFNHTQSTLDAFCPADIIPKATLDSGATYDNAGNIAKAKGYMMKVPAFETSHATNGDLYVKMSTDVADGTIYYTRDGSDPRITKFGTKKYKNGISLTITEPCTIKAIVVSDGYVDKKVSSIIVKELAFHGNGSSNKLVSRRFNAIKDTVTMDVTVPTRPTYTFAGWNVNSDDSGKHYDTITDVSTTDFAADTTTLYAIWKDADGNIAPPQDGTHGITYVLNGGTNASDNPARYKEGEEVILKDPVQIGFDFAGWYSDAKFTKPITKISATSTTDKTVYAKWTAHTYYVIFRANGGVGTMESFRGCQYGNTYKLPANTYTRKGYIFKGWTAYTDGSGTLYKDQGEITNLTDENNIGFVLYAQWTKESEPGTTVNGGETTGNGGETTGGSDETTGNMGETTGNGGETTGGGVVPTTSEVTTFGGGTNSGSNNGETSKVNSSETTKKASIKLNAKSTKLQKGKSSKALLVSKKSLTMDVIRTVTSSNTKVLKVSLKKGKIIIKGIKTGKAVVTVKMKSGAVAKCKITVQKGKVKTTKLKPDKKNIVLSKGKSTKVSITRNPITATEKIKFTSSNKAVAVVNRKGKITAKGTGSCIVTARSANGKKVKIKVTVK